MKHIPGTFIEINKPVLGSIKQYFQRGKTYTLYSIVPDPVHTKSEGPFFVTYTFACDSSKFSIKHKSVQEADAMIDYLLTLS